MTMLMYQTAHTQTCRDRTAKMYTNALVEKLQDRNKFENLCSLGSFRKNVEMLLALSSAACAHIVPLATQRTEWRNTHTTCSIRIVSVKFMLFFRVTVQWRKFYIYFVRWQCRSIPHWILHKTSDIGQCLGRHLPEPNILEKTFSQLAPIPTCMYELVLFE